MRWLKGVLLPALLLCAALGLLVLGFHLRPAPAPAQARDAPALAGRFLKTNRGALDLKRKPAFFFGPHVPLEFFEEIALLPPEKRPHLVALSGTKREIDSLLRRAGLRENYCTCSGASPTDTVPSLVWAKDGRVVCYTCSVALEEIREMKYPLLLAAAEIPNPPGPGGNNAIRAAESIDGAVVGPGEVFSFYEHVGIPSAGRGYLPARSLIETSEGPEWIEDIGGGICRTATVLQFAVEKAGLEG
ncbi:MAG: VanW family protein [Firmicutes bacterium]|nr:VanW family protein [Bacillota bacterium]